MKKNIFEIFDIDFFGCKLNYFGSKFLLGKVCIKLII